MVRCEICGFETPHWIGSHLQEIHGMSIEEYIRTYPDKDVASPHLRQQVVGNARRSAATTPKNLTVSFGPLKFSVNVGVPEEVCLPMPKAYRVPRVGQLAHDIGHALISLQRARSMYIHGFPGTGKDALFHAWSNVTRTPAIIRQVVPGTDIESWFFSRGFNETGTIWEEGDVLVALRDGYTTEDGTKVPYLFLVSDLDRADRSQAEHLRLITDTIQGRVNGPRGHAYKVLPGTRVAATANTAGGGDSRGRMVSANPIDASILDRFDRKFHFHWMDWSDEFPIVQEKFPTLFRAAPEVFDQIGNVTRALRDAIQNDMLLAEFSHRGLCSILEHAEDLVVCGTGKAPENLLQRAARAWTDGLPDDDTRSEARKLMDPHVRGGMIDFKEGAA